MNPASPPQGIPGTRIHLRTEGLPQELAEPVTFLITHALAFCARPAVFPEFQRAATEHEEGWALERIRTMHPALLTEINVYLTAGMAADMEGDES